MPDMAAAPTMLADTSGLRFSLEQAKSMIIAAFDRFDPELGQQARAILATAHYKDGAAGIRAEDAYRAVAYDGTISGDNPYLRADYRIDVAAGARWDITAVPPGQSRLMRTLPASSTASRYDPANPYAQAVIEFEFDGTLNSVVYMAHEIGHAIADDYGREAGHSYRDNPSHLPETQAYLLQHVMYDYLIDGQGDAEIAASARQHSGATLRDAIMRLPQESEMEDRPMSLLVALGLHDRLQDASPFARRLASEALLGRTGPKNINEVLAIAGVMTETDLEQFAQQAIRAASRGNVPAGAQSADVQSADRQARLATAL